MHYHYLSIKVEHNKIMNSNTYSPPECIKFDGYSLQIRPTNTKRFGLEPFRIDSTDFSVKGLKNNEHPRVKMVKKGTGGESNRWFTCRLNLSDGWSVESKTLKRVGKTPQWSKDNSYFDGDCHFSSPKPDDVRKHLISRHTTLSSGYLDICPIINCDFSAITSTAVRNHMDECPLISKWAENGFDYKSSDPNFLENLVHWRKNL